METSPEGQSIPASSKQSARSITGGLILILLGVLFLADNLMPAIRFRDYWPLILVAIGVWLIVKAKRAA
jgi:hypothetical protein